MEKYYRGLKSQKWANLTCGVFCVTSLFAIIAAFTQYNNGELPFEILLIIFILFFSIFLMLFSFIYRNTVTIKKNQKTVELFLNYGTKVSGEIKRIVYRYNIKNKECIPKGPRVNSVEGNVAIVEFEYNGEKKTIETPLISFSKERLRDKNVTVYIYQDQYYVGGYNLEEIKTNEYVEKEKNNIRRYLITFFTFAILFVIIGLLGSNDIIDKDLTRNAMIILFISYFASMLICAFEDTKNIIDKFKDAFNKDGNSIFGEDDDEDKLDDIDDKKE